MTSLRNLDTTAILLIHCPDQKGILAAVTDFINVNKGNIIYLDQHVDRKANVFFMRVEWELEQFTIPTEKIEEFFNTLYAKKYQMNFRLYFGDQKPKMAIFVSKMSHCLFDLLAHYSSGDWNVEIPCIISNHADLEPIVNNFGIAFHHFPITKDNKEQQEVRELELLASYGVNVIVLARYMQIISDDFVACYPNRIINIHHSTLPAFIGAKPYHAAYVTADLDAGPIIEQDVARISHKDTVEMLVHRGQDIEKIVLSRAVEKHIERKILVYQNRTVVFN
ncbi:MAG: formyltetrahydrofolate deformylase [Bacteroidia bacterium]|nr:formyltetrahydrofolate deformylase [Bacteroidia bacterium]